VQTRFKHRTGDNIDDGTCLTRANTHGKRAYNACDPRSVAAAETIVRNQVQRQLRLIFQETDSTSSCGSFSLGHSARCLSSRLLLLSREKTLGDVMVERDLVRLRFVPTPAIDAHWRQHDIIRRLLTTSPLPRRSTTAVATVHSTATTT
jgi:hypothetical protein